MCINWIHTKNSDKSNSNNPIITKNDKNEYLKKTYKCVECTLNLRTTYAKNRIQSLANLAKKGTFCTI